MDAGCAIFDAIRRLWPMHALRVADRGLREGILIDLMQADGIALNRVRGPHVAGRYASLTVKPLVAIAGHHKFPID